MMLRAGLSLELPPGLKPSSLANSEKCARGKRRVSWTTGVLPVSDNTPALRPGETSVLIIDMPRRGVFWARPRSGLPSFNLALPHSFKDGRQHAFNTLE